ncbi:Cell division control protein 50 [Dictyocoela muelleri]|nr:Cell division control protein 50 [Dictyocoela muelleri]
MIKEFINKRMEEIINDKIPGMMINRWYNPLKYILIIFSVISISIGTYLTIYFSSLFSITLPYTSKNKIEFTIDKDINKPLFFYIEVHDFYQNHLLFRQNIDFKQLYGEKTYDLSNCAPLDRNNGKIIYPCGLIPNSFLQDNFFLYQNNKSVIIFTKNINLDSQKNKIKKPGYSGNEIVKPPLWKKIKTNLKGDEKFTNWINVSAFTPFRKLYGRINGLKKGNYTLEIENTFKFGKKFVHIAESSFIGNKNYVLSTFMIINGFLAFITALYIVNNIK